MSGVRTDAAMTEPNRSLSPPDSYIYTGPMSTAGRKLNRFALSLKSPENRKKFLADEAAYMRDFALSGSVMAQVAARDWTGLLKSGGHLQAILKIAATVGQGLWHIGAHNVHVPVEEMIAMCPRHVGGLPESI
jgi:protocatechuate 4,5-dioxygenase alpha chain